MNKSLLETNLFSGFFSEKGVEGLPGLRNLLKGESALFDREKYFQSSEIVAIFHVHPILQSPSHVLHYFPYPPWADLFCQLMWCLHVLVANSSGF